MQMSPDLTRAARTSWPELATLMVRSGRPDVLPNLVALFAGHERDHFDLGPMCDFIIGAGVDESIVAAATHARAAWRQAWGISDSP